MWDNWMRLYWHANLMWGNYDTGWDWHANLMWDNWWDYNDTLTKCEITGWDYYDTLTKCEITGWDYYDTLT
jgi:hypothetical protein